LGGSMLGITFFHASTNVSSGDAAAGRSVENGRALAAAREDRDKMRVAAWRNMVDVDRSGSQGRRGAGVGFRPGL
jgi:hypothetical protein